MVSLKRPFSVSPLNAIVAVMIALAATQGWAADTYP